MKEKKSTSTLEHREQIFDQLKKLQTDCRLFNDDLHGEQLIQSSFSRIDQWERQSIDQIRSVAEKAREDLSNILQRTRNQLNGPFQRLNEDVQTETIDDETKLKSWNVELNQLRQYLEKSLKKTFVQQDSTSIPLIKIQDTETIVFTERFQKASRAISLSEDHRTATCNEKNWNGSTISGHCLYTSGVHSIRFQVNRKGRNNFFFGVTSSAKEPNPWNRRTPLAFGWWNFPVLKTEDESNVEQHIRNGDQFTLTLDCDHRQISLEHHRTKRIVDEIVSYEQCPLPWRIAIVLYSSKDSISLLP